MFEPALLPFAGAAVGLVAVGAQTALVRGHLACRERVLGRGALPGMSVLKPLCGLDDGLEENLASFAALDYPAFEIVLGVASPRDPAWAVALAATRRWPGRFRAVVQRGEPGLNPKVNQLVTLAREARHDVLVVSDSNVRVEPGYLAEIAALLDDPAVGLVTHAIAGVGERSLGSLFDHLHLAGSISPGVVAAQRLGGHDIVVGKSMAFRRADLASMGGFEAVKDVLAEDYVMGRSVSAVLGKRVAVARHPIQNVSERRTVSAFASRYKRWSVLQRQCAGLLPYAALALLNPVLLAALGFAVAPSGTAALFLAATCVAKAALDGAAARALRPGGFHVLQLALVPVKDLVFGAMWAVGLVRSTVAWRGTRIRVGPGSRIAEPAPLQRPEPGLRARA
jgi:ceramide glucosyltransferase